MQSPKCSFEVINDYNTVTLEDVENNVVRSSSAPVNCNEGVCYTLFMLIQSDGVYNLTIYSQNEFGNLNSVSSLPFSIGIWLVYC